MTETPSMDPDRITGAKLPSPPTREVWQFEADKLLGFNGPPWPTDEQRRAALVAAGLEHWIPGATHRKEKTTHAKRKRSRRKR